MLGGKTVLSAVSLCAVARLAESPSILGSRGAWGAKSKKTTCQHPFRSSGSRGACDLTRQDISKGVRCLQLYATHELHIEADQGSIDQIMLVQVMLLQQVLPDLQPWVWQLCWPSHLHKRMATLRPSLGVCCALSTYCLPYGSHTCVTDKRRQCYPVCRQQGLSTVEQASRSWETALRQAFRRLDVVAEQTLTSVSEATQHLPFEFRLSSAVCHPAFQVMQTLPCLYAHRQGGMRA